MPYGCWAPNLEEPFEYDAIKQMPDTDIIIMVKVAESEPST